MRVYINFIRYLPVNSHVDGADPSRLSSGALGGIVAGVFVGFVILICVALVGFCCWNNYQDSRVTSYTPPQSSGIANPGSRLTDNDPSSAKTARSMVSRSGSWCCCQLNFKDCCFRQNNDTNNVCHNNNCDGEVSFVSPQAALDS